MPGLSRKAVQLARDPGNLLHNLPAYAAAVPGRLAYKRDGHLQKASVKSIIEGGHLVVSLDLIVFATLFRDVMSKLVSPWAFLVQDMRRGWGVQIGSLHEIPTGPKIHRSRSGSGFPALGLQKPAKT